MRTFPKVRNTAISSIRNKIIIPFFIYHLRTPLLIYRFVYRFIVTKHNVNIDVLRGKWTTCICYIYKYSSNNQQWWTEWKILYSTLKIPYIDFYNQFKKGWFDFNSVFICNNYKSLLEWTDKSFRLYYPIIQLITHL